MWPCRYWTTKGPQQALFVPGPWLRAGVNEVVLMELELSPPVPHVVLTDRPDFGVPQAPREGTSVLGALLHSAMSNMLHAHEHSGFFLMDGLARSLGFV